MESVWVFNGIQPCFPSGVFTNRAQAESWILLHKLTGTLTEYPLDIGMYEYSVEKKLFKPHKEEHWSSIFIGRFSGGGLNHFHYEDGQC